MPAVPQGGGGESIGQKNVARHESATVNAPLDVPPVDLLVLFKVDLALAALIGEDAHCSNVSDCLFRCGTRRSQ